MLRLPSFSTFVITVMLLLPWERPVAAHPDHQDPGLIYHFAATGHALRAGEVRDETHGIVGKMVGKPRLQDQGPTPAITFDGVTDHLILVDSPQAAAFQSPTTNFSVAAWVNLARAEEEYGGILGTIQDNGDSEQGWLLGYREGHFSFALASHGADDGDGKLTYLQGKSALTLNRWYYVVGTYDGHTMRLYVNGQVDAEDTTTQSGHILYPPATPLVMGAYLDENESYGMQGAVYEAKIYNRVLSAQEIAAVVAKHEKLVRFTTTNDRSLAFVVQPYLQSVSQSQASILCETNRPATMSVRFGQQVPLTNHIEGVGADTIARCTLEGLTAGRVTYYQVTCTDKDDPNQAVTSELLSLQTDRGPEQAWAFGIVGDTQRNPQVTQRCAEGLYAHRPDMLIHCGDVVDDGYAKSQWVGDLFAPMAPLLSRVCMFPTIGNHEKNSHWYYDYFHVPDPEYYYTFRFGNAQFFMIDSNKPLDAESEQYRWLESEMSKCTATWKFTCHHHPCFSSDENDYGDHKSGKFKSAPSYGDRNAQKLIPLYEKYGVDIAFNGHIHVYERTWPIYQMTINQRKGVRYITSGGGGGGLEQAAPQRTWFNLEFARAFHYCTAVIHDRTIQFKAFDIDQRLIDTFELTKAEDR